MANGYAISCLLIWQEIFSFHTSLQAASSTLGAKALGRPEREPPASHLGDALLNPAHCRKSPQSPCHPSQGLTPPPTTPSLAKAIEKLALPLRPSRCHWSKKACCYCHLTSSSSDCSPSTTGVSVTPCYGLGWALPGSCNSPTYTTKL